MPYSSLITAFELHLENYCKIILQQKPIELYEPEAYILKLGGKRIRPLLALIGCDLFDKDYKIALDAALSVELFHNFSLIHDDILDAAPLRRNQPTVHTKWNTNIAILSGDVMLVKAFKILENYSAEEFKKLHLLFSKTSIEVCEGQQNDMNFEKRNDVSVEDYIEMITNKTAVLLGCSLQMGAICAQANTEQQQAIYNFGKHLGIAFQLLDDYLDAFAPDKAKFGKQVGGDIISNKKTYLLIKALSVASQNQLTEINNLFIEQDNNKKVKNMLQLYTDLNVKQHCLNEADKHTKIAIEELYKLNTNALKTKTLENFALNLLQRSI
jgi:geranylgeranyl diphosphate synthase type II